MLAVLVGCQSKKSASPSDGDDPQSIQLDRSYGVVSQEDGADRIRPFLEKVLSGINPSTPIHSLSAVKGYNFESSDIEHREFWLGENEFDLPSEVKINRGQSGNHWVTFEFVPQNEDSIVCIYKGVGSKNKTSNGCSVPNGDKYTFDYCIPKEEFLDEGCTSNINECRDEDEVLDLSPSDRVSAVEVALILNNGDRCGPTEVEFDLENVSSTSQNVLECGDIVEAPFELTQDLDCTGFTGIALTVFGEGTEIKGNGHKIIAPNAQAGLLVLGSELEVTGFDIQGVTNGIGMLSYDVPEIKIVDNVLNDSLINLEVGFETEEPGEIEVKDNKLKGAGLFGFRAYGSGAVDFEEPYLRNNDTRNSDGYAVKISADKYELNTSDSFNIRGSRNGIYFEGGEFMIDDVDFDNHGIQENVIFVAKVEKFEAKKVDLSGNGQQSIGFHIYNTKTSELNNIKANGLDVGVKLAREGAGVFSSEIKNSEMKNSKTAGVMIQSYDGSIFDDVSVKNNDLSQNPADYALWIVDTTNILNLEDKNNSL